MDITLKVTLNGSGPLCVIECIHACVLLPVQPCNMDAGAESLRQRITICYCIIAMDTSKIWTKNFLNKIFVYKNIYNLRYSDAI